MPDEALVYKYENGTSEEELLINSFFRETRGIAIAVLVYVKMIA